MPPARDARPAAKPPAPGQTPTGAAPSGSTPRPVAAEGEDYAGPALPIDFAPPRKKPVYMTPEGVKELLTAEQEKALLQELVKDKFSSVMSAGELNESTKKVVDKVARFYVHQMTQPKYYIFVPKPAPLPGAAPTPAPTRNAPPPPTIATLRKKLVQSVLDAGRLMVKNNNDAAAARKFRDYYCQQISLRAEELLDGHIAVRMNAVLLLGELTSLPGDSKANVKEEPYVEAAVPLIKVISNPEQPDSVKIPAARGLARINLSGKAKAELKLKIGLALAAEFQRKNAHFWYQTVLADALGCLDSVIDQSQKPFVAQVLSEALVDDARHCLVRSEAAKALGRIPLEGNVNIPLVAFEIARFTQALSENYSKDPQAIHWRECFWKTYCAFRPETPAARDRGDGLLTKVEKGGGTKHKAFVDEGYQHCLPLFVHVFDSKNTGLPFPPKLGEPLEEWLKKKRPEDNRVAPNLKPLVASDSRPSAQ